MAQTGILTEDDVERFQSKLIAWGAGLDDAERAILDMILMRAFPDEEGDVEGFIIRRRLTLLFPTLVGQQYSLGGVTDESI